MAPFSPSALLIDLDDTLYDERDYVASGFLAVARSLKGSFPYIDWPTAGALQREMLETLDREGRGKIFNRLFEGRGAALAQADTEKLVSVYREHQPEISLYFGVTETLRDLRARHKLALVTNGLPQMQRNKVAALELDSLFDTIIYCDELGKPKPDPAGIEAALRALKIPPQDALMVGDNPETDGQAAQAAGVPFLRVRSCRFAHLPCEAPEVNRFSLVADFVAAGFST